MNRDMIYKKLVRIREQLANLQEKEKTLAEELEMADKAARREMADRTRLTPAELQLRMSITEAEIAVILAQREKGEGEAEVQEETAYEAYEENESETDETGSEM